jgi:7-cyano-7-deazaguanine reductase
MDDPTEQARASSGPQSPGGCERDALRPGERAIAEAKLVALPNPATQRDYLINFSYPEFTCKCPMTGYPDFAVIDIWMVPAGSIVELKSLKLWLNRFRNEYGFHEEVTNRILDELVAVGEPKWARIVAAWNPRGNLSTVISAEHSPGNRPDELLEVSPSGPRRP